MSPASKDVVSRASDDALVVYLLRSSLVFNDDIDRVADAMQAAVSSAPTFSVVLDFSAVRQVSSAFISKVLALDRRLKDEKRGLVLCGLRTDVMEVFKLLRLNRIFRIVKDEYVALNEIKSG